MLKQWCLSQPGALARDLGKHCRNAKSQSLANASGWDSHKCAAFKSVYSSRTIFKLRKKRFEMHRVFRKSVNSGHDLRNTGKPDIRLIPDLPFR